MKKMINWFKKHLPTKRRLIQIYAALLFNANLKGFKTGNIYTGKLKNLCTPGLNCYSCPGATGACPLGSLQNALASSGKTAPYYVFGILVLYGLLFGRWICGFLCPFGLIQELLHKIPTPKIKKNRFTRVLSYLKYVIFAFFVILLPIAYAFRSFPLPGFCKYICPAGTLEGAMGLLSNKVNESYLRMLGPLFTWKFLLMVSFLVMCVFMFRFFCRFFCPLGLIYGLFNKICLLGVHVDQKSCTDCGLCVNHCKMDIRRVGDVECIQCGECISVCPTNAIQRAGRKFFIDPDAPQGAAKPTLDKGELETVKKRNKAVKLITGSLMVLLLGGVLLYCNLPEKPADSADTPVEDETADTAGTGEGNEPATPSAPVGTAVGNACPAITLDLIGSDEKFVLADNKGKVTVLNFWFTTCGPCLEELPAFYTVASDYADRVSVVAIHVEQKGVDVPSFIANESGHPEWNDGTMKIAWDTGMTYQRLFRIQACPVTVVIDGDGIITDYFIGGLHQEELVAAVEKALG